MGRRLILASASPARLYLLKSAGLNPQVVVSEVDEGGMAGVAAADAVLVLAERKARAVARRHEVGIDGALIVGCDSLLEFEGAIWGKPDSSAEVAGRWRRLRKKTGVLHTGHFVVDSVTGSAAGATDSAVIRFGDPSDREIAAYSKTAEALSVAGPFTLEGRSAPWVDSIEGNYGTVTGISLPILRKLLLSLGVDLVDLWS